MASQAGALPRGPAGCYLSRVDDPTPAADAATLVLLRRGADGASETLLLERSQHLFFAAGCLVFPGGRVDADDRAIAAAFGAIAPADAAARVCAIRETIEEAGVAVGLSPVPGAGAVAAIRAGLAAGVPFSALLRDHGLTVDPDALVPFARWRPGRAKRVFDTRFYVAAVDGGDEAAADGSETVRALWIAPEAAIADGAAGRQRIMFPTVCNLEWVASHGDIAAIRAAAPTYPDRVVSAWHEERDGETWRCIPDDLGYPIAARRIDLINDHS